MTKDPMTTTYRGYDLIYYERDDIWGLCAHDIPINMGTLPEVRAAIDQWEIDKQKAAGFKVWNLLHDNPKYWSLRYAVFRNGTGAGYQTGTHVLLTRNFVGDPDSLYPLARGEAAMDTPEVAKAIEEAQKAHKAAVEAGKRWHDAKRAIPKVSADEWMSLPERDK